MLDLFTAARRRLAGALVLALAGVAATSIASAARVETIQGGTIAQLPGAGACTSERGREGCATGRGLAGAGAVAISRDGGNAYVASNNSSAVAAFRRDPRTGRLAQLLGPKGCTSEGGVEGCTAGRGLGGAFSLAISPDGRNVYVASFNGIAVFVRDPRSGALQQLPGSTGCIDVAQADGCAPGRALDAAASITVSADGANVYVAASGASGVASFARDPLTGALTQLAGADGCTSDGGIGGCTPGHALRGAFSIALAPGGRFAYVAALDSNAIVALRRDPVTGALTELPGVTGCTSEGGIEGCATGRGLSGPNSVAIAPDGGHLYAASSASSAVAAFLIDSYSGRLIQLPRAAGCTSEKGTEGCATGRALGGAFALATSPDSKGVYVAALDGVAAFLRSPANGTLDEITGAHGCTGQRGTEGCAGGRGLAGTSSVAVSPDGVNVYTTALSSGAVGAFSREPETVQLGVRLSGVPRRCARRSFSVRASYAGTLAPRLLRVTLDRRVIRTTPDASLAVRIGVRHLPAGRHRLIVRAIDLAGHAVQQTAEFSRCAAVKRRAAPRRRAHR